MSDGLYSFSLIEPIDIVEVIIVFSDGKNAFIAKAHTDTGFVFPTFQIICRRELGIWHMSEYDFVFVR